MCFRSTASVMPVLMRRKGVYRFSMVKDMARGHLIKTKVVCIALILCIILFLLAGCGKKEEVSRIGKKLKVVATLFTLYDFARNVAGDRAEVSLLLPPGIEAHSFEPKPKDIMEISSADLFVFTGRYMEPWAEKVLKGVENKNLIVIDASKGIELVRSKNNGRDQDHHDNNQMQHGGHGHGVYDPHIWLDLSNAQKMVDTIRDGMVQKDPENRESYIKNAEIYKKRLDELDRRYKKTLSTCRNHTIIHGGHFAFNYLARRYNLTYYSAYKTSPNAEPTPKQVIGLKHRISQSGIKYIFHEELIEPRVAEVLAKETGAQILRLHGAHNISKEDLDRGVTFISIMEDNLNSLRKGLECQ